MFFCISYLFSSIILSNNIIKIIKIKFKINLKYKEKIPNKNNKKITKKIYKNNIKNNSEELKILIGKTLNCENVLITERGLFQNILITGTIGSGKTSSAMYPITKQLIEFNFDNIKNKVGILMLDVKGNYYKYAKKIAFECNRNKDIVVIEINGNNKYNPLDKPNLKASVLANRVRVVMELFSGNTSESYWIDKSEQIIAECIKLCRAYNKGYVNFSEIHNLVTNCEYYNSKIEKIRNLFLKGYYNKEECYNLITAINFFEKEFLRLDQRTASILKSQITRITSTFMSDYAVSNTFNFSQNNFNSINLSQIIEEGKIVILNMNIAQYKNLSKIIAAFLKLDFQAEVLSRLSSNYKNKERIVAFISDEYQEYITENDADFYAQSREAKCINMVATQSYTSLLKTLNNESVLRCITQNLINKIWFRTDDIYTIEEAQKQIGREEKEKISKSISENAKETRYSTISGKLKAKDSNISESVSSSYEKDYIYDIQFFTQELETFSAIAFLSDGNKVMEPQKINLIPYFRKE